MTTNTLPRRDDPGYNAAYYSANKDALAEKHVAYNIGLKMAAFNAYGGPRCSCCGETLFEGLTIDHIDGNGAKHRTEIGQRCGSGLYRWLKKNNYPPGFQVLCGTCNLAKGTGDRCHHMAHKTAT